MLFEAGSAHGQARLVAVPPQESQDCFSVGRNMLRGAFPRRDDFAERFRILVVRRTFPNLAVLIAATFSPEAVLIRKEGIVLRAEVIDLARFSTAIP